MANYDRIWKILSKRKFEINSKIPAGLICGICENIINNAYNGPCECVFCKKCIENYLIDGDSCPANNSKCKEHKLCMGKNVIKNEKVNKLVAKCQVLCPCQSCDYQCEMRKMCDHVRMCDRKLVNCPFKHAGCTAETIARKHMSDHLLNEVYHHNKLFVKWSLNEEQKRECQMQKELDRMKQLIAETADSIFEVHVDEIKKQKDRINSMEKCIANLKLENEDYRRAIINLQRKNTIRDDPSKPENSSPPAIKDEYNICINKDISANDKKMCAKSKAKSMEKPIRSNSQLFITHSSDKLSQRKRNTTASTISSRENINPVRKKSNRLWSEFLNSFN